jgi:hypothetical protein
MMRLASIDPPRRGGGEGGRGGDELEDQLVALLDVVGHDLHLDLDGVLHPVEHQEDGRDLVADHHAGLGVDQLGEGPGRLGAVGGRARVVHGEVGRAQHQRLPVGDDRQLEGDVGRRRGDGADQSGEEVGRGGTLQRPGRALGAEVEGPARRLGADRAVGPGGVVDAGPAPAVLVDHADDRAGVDVLVLQVPVEPGEGGVGDVGRVAGLGQAGAVAAAVPEHRDGDVVALQDLEVGDRLAQREQRVDRAVDQQGRRADLVDQLARAAVEEPLVVLLAQGAGRLARGVGAGDVGVEAGTAGDGAQHPGPARLHRLVGVEAGLQRVPGDVGHEGVDPAVEPGHGQLDAPAVGGADHADAGVALGVGQGLGLLGHPVEQDLDVAALGVRCVHRGGAGRGTEAPWVPGQDVVAPLVHGPDAEGAEDGRALLRRVARLRPARAHEDRRGGVVAGGEPVDPDGGAVERRHVQVAGHAVDRHRHDGVGRRPLLARRELRRLGRGGGGGRGGLGGGGGRGRVGLGLVVGRRATGDEQGGGEEEGCGAHGGNLRRTGDQLRREPAGSDRRFG